MKYFQPLYFLKPIVVAINATEAAATAADHVARGSGSIVSMAKTITTDNDNTMINFIAAQIGSDIEELYEVRVFKPS